MLAGGGSVEKRNGGGGKQGEINANSITIS